MLGRREQGAGRYGKHAFGSFHQRHDDGAVGAHRRFMDMRDGSQHARVAHAAANTAVVGDADAAAAAGRAGIGRHFLRARQGDIMAARLMRTMGTGTQQGGQHQHAGGTAYVLLQYAHRRSPSTDSGSGRAPSPHKRACAALVLHTATVTPYRRARFAVRQTCCSPAVAPQARCPSATQPRLAGAGFGLGAMPLLFSASRMMLRMLSLAAGPGANA